jgi:threonine dehydrogenase-like Zn-dependent dehydrogenase
MRVAHRSNEALELRRSRLGTDLWAVFAVVIAAVCFLVVIRDVPAGDWLNAGLSFVFGLGALGIAAMLVLRHGSRIVLFDGNDGRLVITEITLTGRSVDTVDLDRIGEVHLQSDSDSAEAYLEIKDGEALLLAGSGPVEHVATVVQQWLSAHKMRRTATEAP